MDVIQTSVGVRAEAGAWDQVVHRILLHSAKWLTHLKWPGVKYRASKGDEEEKGGLLAQGREAS